MGFQVASVHSVDWHICFPFNPVRQVGTAPAPAAALRGRSSSSSARAGRCASRSGGCSPASIFFSAFFSPMPATAFHAVMMRSSPSASTSMLRSWPSSRDWPITRIRARRVQAQRPKPIDAATVAPVDDEAQRMHSVCGFVRPGAGPSSRRQGGSPARNQLGDAGGRADVAAPPRPLVAVR